MFTDTVYWHMEQSEKVENCYIRLNTCHLVRPEAISFLKFHHLQICVCVCLRTHMCQHFLAVFLSFRSISNHKIGLFLVRASVCVCMSQGLRFEKIFLFI